MSKSTVTSAGHAAVLNYDTPQRRSRAEELTALLGQAIDNTDHLKLRDHVHRLAGAGLAVLFIAPHSKVPSDCRTSCRKLADDKAAQDAARAAGRSNWKKVKSPSGVSLATTDIAVLDGYLDEYVKTWGPDCSVNLAVAMGPSRLVVVDCDTKAQTEAFLTDAGEPLDIPPTVTSPGSLDPQGNWVHEPGNGHYWFVVPDGVELPAGSNSMTVRGEDGQDGYAVKWGDNTYVLIPPSTRKEGPYAGSGPAGELPNTLLDMITQHGRQRAQRAGRGRERALGDEDPITRYFAEVPWWEILEPTVWMNTGKSDNCGCDIWTAPGLHASPKSATAHEVGCSTFTDSPDPPLMVWTDHDVEPFERYLTGGIRTVSRFQAHAAIHHGGNEAAAIEELDLDDLVTLGERVTINPDDATDDATRGELIREMFGGEPLPLRVGGLPPFPVHALPPVLRKMAEAAAAEIEVDTAMTAPMSIAAVSGAINGYAEVKVRPGWVENGVTYTLVLLGSGERKSAAFKTMFNGPLTAVERELTARYWEPELAQPEPDSPFVVPVEPDLGETSPPQLLASDVTAEALARRMQDNGGNIVVGDAEGDVFDILLGMYTHTPSLNLYLKSYTGEDVRIDRANKPSIRLDRPSLTICITTQLEVWQKALGNERFLSKGLVARMEFVYPKTRQEIVEARGRLNRTRVVPAEVSDEYRQTIMSLAMDARERGMSTAEFAPAAQMRIASYGREIEDRTWDPEGDLHFGALKAWGAKCAGRVARRALHLHLADVMAVSGVYGIGDLIQLDAVEKAIEIEEWVIANVRAAFGLSTTGDVSQQDAVEVLDWLHREHAKAPLHPVSQRELLRRGPRTTRQRTKLAPVLELLDDLNWVKRTKHGKADVLWLYPTAQ